MAQYIGIIVMCVFRSRGMQPTDPPLVGEKNNPLMPVAWTKSYRLPGMPSKLGKVFNTTMGSSNDFLSEGLRRLIVQGVFWACGLEEAIPPQGLEVDIVPPYHPSDFGFRSDEEWVKKDLQPSSFSSISILIRASNIFVKTRLAIASFVTMLT